MKDNSSPVSLHLSEGQRKKIFLETRKAGFSNEDLHRHIQNEYGVDSISSLNRKNALRLIRFLINMKEYRQRQCHKSKAVENVFWLATIDQLSFINKLAEDLEWDPEHLEAWLNKYQKVKGLRYLRKDKASKVICILKKMVASKKAKAKGMAR